MNMRDLATIAALCLTAPACKKDPKTPPAPAGAGEVGTGTVRLSFSFVNGQDPFDINGTYHDGAGHAVRFSTLKFYVSNIHLSDDAGNSVGHFDQAWLVDGAGSGEPFTLGTIPAAHVHEAHFHLGLDSAVNHADPLTAAYPLNVPDMHWSWNPTAGYKFLNMEGKVDGNGDGDLDDPEDVVFTYHCATDALLRSTHLHIHANVNAGATATMEATVDVAVLLSGLDLLANPMAMGGGSNNVIAMDSLVSAIGGH